MPVAEALLTQGMVRFEDSVMYVTRHDVVSVTRATVQVSNLPASFKQDTLRLLFEDTKQSGGGPIDNIEYDVDTGRALITFKDSAGICLSTFCQSSSSSYLFQVTRKATKAH